MLTIKYELPKSERFEVVPISDVHIGNPLCQEHLLKQIVDYVMEEPADPNCARICLLNGDLTESVTRTSVGNVFDLTMTPSVQIATMIKYLLPLTETSEKYPQGKILSYCAGNHDEGRYKDTGISAAESIAVGLHLEDRFSKDGCYSFISVPLIGKNNKDGVYTLYNTHLTGGGTTAGAKANRISRISNGIFANCIVGSHFHQPMTFKEDMILPVNMKRCLQQKTITYVITGAFLSYGDFAQRSGFKPSTLETPKILVRQDRVFDKRDDHRVFRTEVIL